MPLEIETKVKVDSCDAARSRLEELGARHVCSVLETNQIFDTPDQALFRRGCGLRIRTCRGEGSVPAATLTFKGPQRPGALKTRDELETPVGDADAAMAILEALGYRAVMTFEKRREEWELDGLTIELDELPRLGCFVEIEGPDEPSVRRGQERLDLDDRPSITATYIALLIDHARQNGLDFSKVTFD